MVSEFFIGLKVGATLSGVFDNAFRSARSAMDDLRKCSLRLSDAQKDLAGNVERTRRAYAGLDLARLERQHRQLEATLGRLTRQHDAWQASLRRGWALSIAPGGALQSTLRIQQSRIEVMASVRLSASIRMVEQKLESQRRDQDKAERNLPPAGEPRSGARGGQGTGSKSGNRSGGNDAGDAPAKRSSVSSPSSSPSGWRWPSIDLSLGKLRLPTRQELIRVADFAQKAGAAVANASGKAHAALSTGQGRKTLDFVHGKLDKALGGRLPSVEKILDGLKTAETVGQVVSKTGQLAGVTLRSLDGVKWSDLKPGNAGKSLTGAADYAKRGGAVIADASGRLHAALSKGEGREALDFVHGKLDKALGGKLPSVDKILGGLKTAETVGQVVSKTGQLAGVTLRSLDGVKWSDLKPGNAGKSLTGAADYAKRGGAVIADASGKLRAALSKGEGREALDFVHGKLDKALGGKLPSVDKILGGLKTAETVGQVVSKTGQLAGVTLRSLDGVKWSDLKPGNAGKSLTGAADYAKRGGAVIADASGRLHAALSKGEGREALDFVHGKLDQALGGKLPSVEKILGGLKTAETVGQVVSKTGQLAGVTLRSLDGVKWSDLKPGNAGKSLTGAADYAKRGGAVIADASGKLRAALSKGEGREALDYVHGKLNAKLGGVLPSVDSILGGLGQLEELGKTVSKAGGMAGKALRAYAGASGNVFQKTMAAAGTLLGGDEADGGSQAGGKGGKGKKRPAAKPAPKTAAKTATKTAPKSGAAARPPSKAKAESPAKPKAAAKPVPKPKPAAKLPAKPGNALKNARGLLDKGKNALSGLKPGKSGGGLLKTGLQALGKGGKGLKSLIGKADLLGVGMDLLSTSQSNLSPQAKAAAYGKTLGGTAGALAGGAAGAAIGTMLLPGVGTFVGRQVGSWLGQKGGEWLGEKIGNWAGKPSAAPKPAGVPKPVTPPKPVAVPKPAAQAKAVPKPAAKPAAQAQQAQQLQRIQQAASKAAAKPAGPAAAFNITFSPQITVNGASAAGVKQQAQQAMQLSFAEFERMMKRYEADRQRRSYAARG
ncbi:hypothetical protein B0T37_19700 [Chromobacterium violaceum]|uniref:hypothetical protein n=1 Tax=Chromobacterium violaceum TaxID=536 RepID=UPI0009DA5194|nr:hypothetical protein [Chromobacterium violaceum]OQS08371.1 hypothetical protein B0T38_20100 [Chromobacterium violaceum]OQS21315.1 hypothetical protein B0T37_19700 [Chromobacterium violaceum]